MIFIHFQVIALANKVVANNRISILGAGIEHWLPLRQPWSVCCHVLLHILVKTIGVQKAINMQYAVMGLNVEYSLILGLKRCV